MHEEEVNICTRGQQEMTLGGGKQMHKRTAEVCTLEDGGKWHKWMVQLSTRNLNKYTRGGGEYMFEEVTCYGNKK